MKFEYVVCIECVVWNEMKVFDDMLKILWKYIVGRSLIVFNLFLIKIFFCVVDGDK